MLSSVFVAAKDRLETPGTYGGMAFFQRVNPVVKSYDSLYRLTVLVLYFVTHCNPECSIKCEYDMIFDVFVYNCLY